MLNRFDRVVHFHPLTREDIRIIAQQELMCLQERPGLKNDGLQLKIDTSVLDWLTANGFDAHFGARHLRRTIERHVVTAIAEAIVREQPAPHATITLSVRQGRIVAGVTAVCASEQRHVSTEAPGGCRLVEAVAKDTH